MSIVKMGKSLVILTAAMFLFACAGSNTGNSEDVPKVEPITDNVIENTENDEDRIKRENREARQSAGSTVYFELDESVVNSQGRSVLEAHAWFLSQAENSGIIVTVEGYCDERGTPAYNLALGERRAKAVAQILMSYGVSASQIKTVSYGEEKPAALGHDESAWSQNRRGILNYTE